MARTGRRTFLWAAGAALLVTTAAFAAAAPVRVTLTATGTTRLQVGQPARLTATARLPRGAHLLIRAYPPGRRASAVVECRRSPCTGTYRDARAERVRFQASAIRRSGRTPTTLGRSGRLVVTWTKPPPPPPPPAATPGHFEGMLGPAEVFRFDVGADGLSVTSLQTGQINETCEPRVYLSGGNLTLPGPIPVARDGSFSVSATATGTVDGNPSMETIALAGTITGGSATGTLRVDTAYTAQGQAYTCSSGVQTWTATRVG
jgi:hypothetical protein